MNDLLKKYKSEIIDHINEFFRNYRKRADYPGSIISEDSFERLIEFISRGKLIRAILALSSYEALGGKEKKKMLSVAASIELLHAGFLMHDDVMDGDSFRRGAPSMHVSYRDQLCKQSFTNPEKNGESLAVCLGNIAYFLAFDLICRSGFDSETVNRLITAFNFEAVLTGFGQMDDIIAGSSADFPDTESILNIYKMKTARYTFALPLSMGAICNRATDRLIEKIVTAAEGIGLVFQMRDDELNLLSESLQTGKSVGSDIAEGKKTLIISMLLKNASDAQKVKVRSVFAKKKPTDREIKNIKKMIISSGTLEEHRSMIKDISDRTLESILKLKVTDEYKNILVKILEISIKREF